MANRKNHPRQPVVAAKDGVIRFKENRIVQDLLDKCTAAGFGLNEICRAGYDPGDYDQLMQLIGYSVSSYGSLSSSPKATVRWADNRAADILLDAELANPACDDVDAVYNSGDEE